MPTSKTQRNTHSLIQSQSPNQLDRWNWAKNSSSRGERVNKPTIEIKFQKKVSDIPKRFGGKGAINENPWNERYLRAPVPFIVWKWKWDDWLKSRPKLDTHTKKGKRNLRQEKDCICRSPTIKHQLFNWLSLLVSVQLCQISTGENNAKKVSVTESSCRICSCHWKRLMQTQCTFLFAFKKWCQNL